jgi:hypothetical protein
MMGWPHVEFSASGHITLNIPVWGIQLDHSVFQLCLDGSKASFFEKSWFEVPGTALLPIGVGFEQRFFYASGC